MPRVIRMFGPGEGLREVLQCDPADLVLGGLGRWVEDVPGVIADVPAAVETAAPEAAAAPEEPAAGADTGSPASEIDDDLGKPKPRRRAGGKGRKRP